jgi:hypothetical protein
MLMKKLAGFWYSFVVLVLLISALTGILEQYLYTGPWMQAPLVAKIAIPTVLITFVGFWILMLEDFLENEDTKHRILVGLSLFFLHWIAILIYFWAVIYRRKSKQ